ncbi:hypothetical protein PSPO01_16542 [Paraphaeosphaeria sporulosa]
MQHPSTLTSANNLASVLRDQEKYNEPLYWELRVECSSRYLGFVSAHCDVIH